MKTISCLMLLVCTSLSLKAQVNAYAKVHSLSGTVLQLSHVNETHGTFEAGQQILLLQMQDGTLGSTANDITFGTPASVLTAGTYEVASILQVNESAGVPQSIELQNPLSLSFNPSASLQAISYPVLGTGNYTTTAPISAVPWNGSIGGVVAFQVNGKLFLQHSISADIAGFRGGNRSGGSDGGSCISNAYISAVSTQHGGKGEGIYPSVYGNSAHAYASGRAPLINGGGGGSVHNAGGGGGANFAPGAIGGEGWSCTSSAGGMGGYDLSGFSSTARLFMGGGGGGGHENNNQGSSGSNGGGIVWIKADSIIIQNCLATITAKGGNAPNSTSDGAGGAGGGGSIILWTSGMRKTVSCSYTISADGGNGGSVISLSLHGGGGGGGGGVIYSPLSTIPPAIGQSSATGASGLNSLPLTASLLNFKAIKTENDIKILWQAEEDGTTLHYDLLVSTDAAEWQQWGRLQGSGTSGLREYSLTLPATLLYTYFKLRITEHDDTWFSHIINTQAASEQHLVVYPNPASAQLQISPPCGDCLYRVRDGMGKTVLSIAPGGESSINIATLASGVYWLEVVSSQGSRTIAFSKW